MILLALLACDEDPCVTDPKLCEGTTVVPEDPGIGNVGAPERDTGEAVGDLTWTVRLQEPGEGSLGEGSFGVALRARESGDIACEVAFVLEWVTNPRVPCEACTWAFDSRLGGGTELEGPCEFADGTGFTAQFFDPWFEGAEYGFGFAPAYESRGYAETIFLGFDGSWRPLMANVPGDGWTGVVVTGTDYVGYSLPGSAFYYLQN